MPRILVVDDDRSLCDLLSDALTDEGYSVEAFTVGESALAALADGSDVDLVVLDLYFPHMHGLTFLRRYRERGGQAKVVITSGVPEKHPSLRGAGGDHFLAKPFELDTLLAVVRDLASAGTS